MTNCDECFSSLMRRVSEGSEDAAWEVVTQYGDEIRQAVRRVLSVKLRPKFDSLDFVQIVWKSFFRVRDKSGQFKRPEQLAAYLVRVARNKVGMETRRRLDYKKYNVRREQSLDQSGGDSAACQEAAPIEVAIARERWNQILEGQPAHYRQIIQMRLRGYTCEDICKATRIPERTVRRCLQKLLHTAAA
jgi:RNA polymerase sigma-70 factor (ECF subfamily)